MKKDTANYSLLRDQVIKKYPDLQKIVQVINTHNGKALLVGGAVRDLLRTNTIDQIKDLDIEVYGLTFEQLESILRTFGPVRLAGKSFGVLMIDGLPFDWSIPRSDSAGRKPTVELDPYLSYEKAFARRDVTINAIGLDLTSGELIDPFNGLHDLQKGILRTPSAQRFVEDPLRLYRVMQFIGRFEMQPDAQLNEVCKKMEVEGVSRERIEQEIHKLLLLSKKPALGLRWLHTIGRLKDLLPEIAELELVPQEKKWHPEGDVLEHSLQALDAAAVIAQQYTNNKDKLILLYAALFHDIGKKETTKHTSTGLHSYGHAEVGARKTRAILARIEGDKEIIKTVCKLVNYHMMPLQFIKSRAGISAYKRLALKLMPETSIEMLVNLSYADRRGRNEARNQPLTTEQPDLEQFLAQAHKANVQQGPEKPILQAQDLLDVVSPGPQLGQLLKKAYQIQIDEGVTDPEILKQRVLNNKE